MVSKRPSVYIYTNHPQPEILYQICSGIEEEGVFYEVIPRKEMRLEELTYQAATESMLGSGIGIYENKAAFQVKGLSKGCYVFHYTDPKKGQARLLGSNSARAVKKLSFKEWEEIHEGLHEDRR